jgi:hypothetical protein
MWMVKASLSVVPCGYLVFTEASMRSDDMVQIERRMERRHLERKALHLRRELRDWPMTAERRDAKTAELKAIRVELLGSV